MSASLEVVVVTGLSGSGKSTAIHVLEDLGFYCIDNLPLVLVSRVLELCTTSLERINRVALGIDVRERQFFSAYPRVLDELHRAGYRLEVLFFNASDDVLVRRFSETRRPHPLGGEAGPLAGIQRERTELSPNCARAPSASSTPARSPSISCARSCTVCIAPRAPPTSSRCCWSRSATSSACRATSTWCSMRAFSPCWGPIRRSVRDTGVMAFAPLYPG